MLERLKKSYETVGMNFSGDVFLNLIFFIESSEQNQFHPKNEDYFPTREGRRVMAMLSNPGNPTGINLAFLLVMKNRTLIGRLLWVYFIST